MSTEKQLYTCVTVFSETLKKAGGTVQKCNFRAVCSADNWDRLHNFDGNLMGNDQDYRLRRDFACVAAVLALPCSGVVARQHLAGENTATSQGP
jgi:hypothetical protein